MIFLAIPAWLICGMICFAITKVKGWQSSMCWGQAVIGCLLGLFWLPICISKPHYTAGIEKTCLISCTAFRAWLAVGAGLCIAGLALIFLYAFGGFSFGAAGLFPLLIGLYVLLILDQRC